jgi:hypothetical protein
VLIKCRHNDLFQGAKVIGSFLAEATDLVDLVVLTTVPSFVGGLGPAEAFGEAQFRSGSSSTLKLGDIDEPTLAQCRAELFNQLKKAKPLTR